MSTPEERQARANAIEQRLASTDTDNSLRDEIAQASIDSLTDMLDPAVLRLRSFIRRAALTDNPNPVMRRFASAWLQSTEGLVNEAKKEAAAFAARQTPEPTQDED